MNFAKLKKALYITGIFLSLLAMSILPTLARPEQEIKLALSNPLYWIISVILAAFLTFMLIKFGKKDT